MDQKKGTAVILAFAAALFYAVNMPFSKLLLHNIPPTMMAAFLYLGAGTGVGVLYLAGKDRKTEDKKLTRKDFPYTAGMVVLDIAAPVLLMFGLMNTTAANASLLNNFEIVATSMIALFVFKEIITKRLWIAVFLITLSSMILSFESISSIRFSWGSALVLLAALCWGIENNCTRMISSKNVYEIVMIKGIFSGIGSMLIAFMTGENLPKVKYILFALVLGFIAYGLSILFYIKAQHQLGAAKTSAYYAIAPFAGAFFSFLFLNETLTVNYAIALFIMLLGSAVVVIDTVIIEHEHTHIHTIMYREDGVNMSYTLEHSHEHRHYTKAGIHEHLHVTETDKGE